MNKTWQLGSIRKLGGFYSALVKEFGDPKSKMSGLQGVLLGMGTLMIVSDVRSCKMMAVGLIIEETSFYKVVICINVWCFVGIVF